jgi:L-asparaginase II
MVRDRSQRGLHVPDAGRRPAVVVVRGGIVESQHLLRYAICDARAELLESAGDVDAPTYLRSSAKPLICTVIVESGAADRFGFTEEQLAIIAGSHSGEPHHIAAVHDMLAKIGLTESALRCGPHPPIHEPSAEALVAAGERPRRIHNNCSGKHAGILSLAVHLGADVATYLRPDNAAQQAILRGYAEMLGLAQSEMALGVDGCGIPVVAVPMRASATFFAKFVRPERLPKRWQEPSQRVRRAMIDHPGYVAGSGRFDTDLMRAAYPDIACKGGAEGFHASAAAAAGIGMCAKVADGNYRAIPPFVIARLASRNVLDRGAVAALDRHRNPPLRNHAGDIVGEIRAVRSDE